MMCSMIISANLFFYVNDHHDMECHFYHRCKDSAMYVIEQPGVPAALMKHQNHMYPMTRQRSQPGNHHDPHQMT